jgi:flagellar operon protein
MTDKIYVPGAPISVGKPPVMQPKKVETIPGQDFGQILKDRLDGLSDLKFSAHATKRLESRGIKLTNDDLNNLKGAVELAAKKGARESLVLLDNLALVVSIKNKTVITAVDGPSRKENVFTNIDSAVIM